MVQPGGFYEPSSKSGGDGASCPSGTNESRNVSWSHERKSKFYDRYPEFGNTSNWGITGNGEPTPSPPRYSPQVNTDEKKCKRGRIFNGRREKDSKRYWRNFRRRSDEDSSQSSDNEDEPVRGHTTSPYRGDRRINSDNGRHSPRKPHEASDNSTDSSAKSASLSPISGGSSSITDWEDRFVVNMPTAKEPNPPTMTAKQISEFQRSIENVYRNGEAMVDPESLPSPRITTPERDLSASDRKPQQRSNIPKRKSVQRGRLNEANNDSYPTAPGHYYCPEEVGKRGFGAAGVESSPKQNQKAQEVNLDGSFLGCKVINTPGDKNLDEVLLFTPIEEYAETIEVPPPTPTTPEEMTAPSYPVPSGLGKTTASKERDVTSPNSNPAPCSKPSSMKIRFKVRSPGPSSQASRQTPGKDNTQPTCSPPKTGEKQENSPKDDDVFIITPTITRTMVTVKEKEGNTRKRQGIPRRKPRSPGEAIPKTNTRPPNYMPLGLRPGIQNSQGKSTAPYMASSRTGPIGSIPVTQTGTSPDLAGIGGPHTTRGFTRTPGMAKSSTKDFTGGMQNNIKHAATPSASRPEVVVPGRSFSELARVAKSLRCPDISPVSPLVSSPGQSVHGSFRAGKCFEVAELDGLQVGNKPEEHLHPKITDVTDEFPILDLQPDNNDQMNTTLSLVFNIFIIAAAQVQKLYSQYTTNRHIKATLNSIPTMIEHCFHVLRSIVIALSIYRKTGSLPWPKGMDFNQFLAAAGKAIVNMVAFTFFAMVVGRVAWYVVFVGSWIVWFAKPFGWIGTLIGRMVLS